jgi:hypothetical protein
MSVLKGAVVCISICVENRDTIALMGGTWGRPCFWTSKTSKDQEIVAVACPRGIN